MSLDIQKPSVKPGQQHPFTTVPSRRTIIIVVAASIILSVMLALLINTNNSPRSSDPGTSVRNSACVNIDPNMISSAGHTVSDVAASGAAKTCVGQPIVSMLQDAASYYRLGIREFKTSGVDIYSVNDQGVTSSEGDASRFIYWAKDRGASVTVSSDSSGNFLAVRF